jgi:sugar phosphate isomerase/epimerase
MKLGVDIFSLRFNDWDAFRHLSYAADIGLDVVHFSDLSTFRSDDPGYLREVRQEADRLGLAVEVGMGSICPTSTRFEPERGTAAEQLSRMIRIAVVLGSPAVRCYLGGNADRHTAIPLSAHIDATIATCRAVRDEALAAGVKIAIENHAGDLQGRELKELIERAGPDFVGACIDSGNPLWVAESPHTTLEHLAPFVTMSHVRDTAVWPHPDGAAAQWVVMGDGNVGIDDWARRFCELCPQVPFTLEVIATLPPKILAYHIPEFWDAYPQALAHEFGRFLALVQSGRPYTRPVPAADWSTLSSTLRAALGEVQQQQLEQSVRYCRVSLGI